MRKQFREIDMDLNKNNKKKEVLIMGGGLGLIDVYKRQGLFLV